jgi:hypothetical protein
VKKTFATLLINQIIINPQSCVNCDYDGPVC